jgi:hypothetical protein
MAILYHPDLQLTPTYSNDLNRLQIEAHLPFHLCTFNVNVLKSQRPISGMEFTVIIII